MEIYTIILRNAHDIGIFGSLLTFIGIGVFYFAATRHPRHLTRLTVTIMATLLSTGLFFILLPSFVSGHLDGRGPYAALTMLIEPLPGWATAVLCWLVQTTVFVCGARWAWRRASAEK